jgi:hypothetical protein
VLRFVLRGPDPFHLWAAIGGVAVLRTLVLLVALADRGAGRCWLNFWTAPPTRTAYITVAFAAFCWPVVVVSVVLRRTYGLGGGRSTGATMLAAGATLALLAGVVVLIGL